MWPLLGMFDFDLYGYTAYGYALAVLFVLFLVARRMINSPFGLSLRGIRENARTHAGDRRAEPFAISARSTRSPPLWPALPARILTQTTETVSLGALDFQRSADMLVMLILGGTGRLYGGLIGAIIYMVARDQFSGINPQYWYFPIGVLLIAVVLFLPNGILGGLAQLHPARPALVRLAISSRRRRERRLLPRAASTRASARSSSPPTSRSRCRGACATR